MSSRNDKNITNPTSNDILCGRGGGTNAHSGNIKFRKLVAAHKLRYLAASKSDKPSVARDVVKEWRGMDPPGRFLAKMDSKNVPKGDDETVPTLWHDVGDKKAREKASQCLRERNGAANEAVAALVKTVTASGEACPEDYATLMNKAALVRAQNDVTIQQQQNMFKMNQQQQQQHQQQHMGQQMNSMRGNGGNSGGGSNDYCQETFEPISLHNHQQNNQGYPLSEGANNRYQETDVEDDLIEAEIQRLLKQREQQLLSRNQALSHNQNDGGGSMSNNSRSPVSPGGGGIMSNNNAYSDNAYSDSSPQPYMGADSVLREYEQLMQKQRELNLMAGKMNGMMGNNNAMNNGMNNNSMGGMMNNDGQGMFSNNNMNSMSHNNMMPQSTMSNSMGMNNNGGMGMNNYGGSQITGMQSNPNPDAAKDYMSRLRMLRQGRGGGNTMPEPAISSAIGGYNNHNGYSGNGGNNNMGNTHGIGDSNNMMNNMGNNMQMQENKGRRAPDEFTIEEYQASLQQFLSHDDGTGGSRKKDHAGMHSDSMMPPQGPLSTQLANMISSQQSPYNVSSTMQCVQVPTNLEDGTGGNKRIRSSLRSVDDTDLPIGRNTFKSVDSVDRPSFQSMGSEDFRGTFRSVDTMDLMSLGNSINEIVEEDIKQHPEMRVKYGRRLSAASRYSRTGNNAVAAALSDFTHLPGQTLEVRTMDHGQGTGQGNAGGGPKRIKKGIDPRLMAQERARHSVQTKDCDGPSSRAATGGRGSQLSIKDLNFDGVDDDASRMSFGNISIMSEMTCFQESMDKGQGDSFNHL